MGGTLVSGDLDSDGDGVPDASDICPGFDDNLDADGDGAPDGCDACALGDDNLDTDSDGTPDACDACALDPDDDADGDGVCGDVDLCAGTVIPEQSPTVKLGINRWALVDGDLIFDTNLPEGQGPARSYNTTQTIGCSCTQIIEAQGLGKGHTKFGCSISVMDEWISLVAIP